MIELPILVVRFDDDHPADALCCPACGFTRKATDDEIGLCEGLPACDKGCTRTLSNGDTFPEFLDWKYAEGEPCEGCGKLGFCTSLARADGWGLPEGVCSRRCQLVAEYQAQLRKAAP